MLSERPIMVLCDIEGTLLDVPEESVRHRQALRQALGQVTGLDVVLPKDRDGHTDYTLILSALEELGVEDLLSEQAFEMIAQQAAAIYESNCPQDLAWYVRPGVCSTLLKLWSDPLIKVVPCSGAVAGIARLLVIRSGLDEPLSVGYGSFARFGGTRPDLVEAARERAGGYAGLPWPADKTVLVSRSASDIVAAHSAGIRTIAVACSSPVAEVGVLSFEDVPGVLARWTQE